MPDFKISLIRVRLQKKDLSFARIFASSLIPIRDPLQPVNWRRIVTSTCFCQNQSFAVKLQKTKEPYQYFINEINADG